MRLEWYTAHLFIRGGKMIISLVGKFHCLYKFKSFLEPHLFPSSPWKGFQDCCVAKHLFSLTAFVMEIDRRGEMCVRIAQAGNLELR